MVKTIGNNAKVFCKTPTQDDIKAAVNILRQQCRTTDFELTFISPAEVPLGVNYSAKVRQITVSFYQGRNGELFYSTHLWRSFPLTDLPVEQIRSIRAVLSRCNRTCYNRQAVPDGIVRGRKK